MTWLTFWWLVVIVVGAGVPMLAYVVMGRILRRAVPDPARRGKAWGRKLKVHRGPGIWRHVVLLIVAALSGVIVLPLGFGVPLPIRLSVWATLALVLIMIALVYAQLVSGHWREKRFYNRLEREGHLICPDCHYSLAGHAAGGHCPECGYAFTPESLVEDWTDVKTLARRRASP